MRLSLKEPVPPVFLLIFSRGSSLQTSAHGTVLEERVECPQDLSVFGMIRLYNKPNLVRSLLTDIPYGSL